MAKFEVTITEISKCKVEIEAETFEQAKKMVEDDYWHSPNDFILEPEDTFFE